MIFSKTTFPGGVHPRYFKQLTENKPIRQMGLPKEVAIPLIQHTGAPCQVKVSVGDKVYVGTKIGESEKYISAPVHSSVAGTVKSIERFAHPTIGKSLAVIIQTDPSDELDPSIRPRLEASAVISGKPRQEPLAVDVEKICQIIREAGIVGLGGAGFPTHVKLAPPKEKPINSFILNGAECEPYLTCDYRLMVEKPKEILDGMKIIMKVLGVDDGYIAIERNKPGAIKAMRKALAEDNCSCKACFALGGQKIEDKFDIRIKVLQTKYPQGAENQLIKVILDREVPSGGLPLDIGVVVNNVGTAFAIYEAVRLGRPLYQRVVTVTGAVNEPCNLWVRIGTLVKDVIEQCGGYIGAPGKIIIGGPMMGIAQYTDEVPVTKQTTGILVISRDIGLGLHPQPILPCLRCGKCVEVCPVGLLPYAISIAAEREKIDLAKEYGAMDCFECGACAYVCPSARPLVQLIKLGKAPWLKSEKNNN